MEHDWKRQNEGAMMTEYRAAQEAVHFPEGDCMS